MEFFCLVLVFNDDERLFIRSRFNFKGPQLYVFLDNLITELSSNQSFGIEDCVDRIFGSLVFGSISNESFCFCEGNIWWGGSVSLVVGNDLNSFVLPDAYAWVGCSKINSYGFTLYLFSVSHCFLIDILPFVLNLTVPKSVLEKSMIA